MKVAIYAIAKNEEKFAEQFMQTCKPADLIVVGDSGSTDRTREIVKSHGGHVINLGIQPWRFDMARNTVLSVLPVNIDVCFAMDFDEKFQRPDWRSLLEKAWVPGQHTRLRFRYVHGFRPDGQPATTGIKDFAHERHNYFWQHAVHETLYYRGPGKENTLLLPELVVEHRQDKQKPRDTYLPLLEQECASITCSPRHVFWLLREYVLVNNWNKVVETCDKFLSYPDTWYVEQAHAYRYRAKALSHLNKPTDALVDHFRSVQIAPKEREVWLDMAWYHHTRKQWVQAYSAVCQALTITNRPEHYLVSDDAWGFKIHELATVCALQLELIQQSKEHMEVALCLSNNDPRLDKLRLQVLNASKGA